MITMLVCNPFHKGMNDTKRKCLVIHRYCVIRKSDFLPKCIFADVFEPIQAEHKSVVYFLRADFSISR